MGFNHFGKGFVDFTFFKNKAFGAIVIQDDILKLSDSDLMRPLKKYLPTSKDHPELLRQYLNGNYRSK